MSRDGSAHGDLCGLTISDLADRDDIRVLAQNGAQTAGEGHAGLIIDLDLVDAADIVLYRILERDQIDFSGIELVDHGVQGSGFTGTGGADNEDHTVLHSDQLAIFFQVSAGKTDFIRADKTSGFVQETRDDLLTVYRGKGRDTKVQVLVADSDIEAAVLGDTALRYIHTAHDLDTGNNRCLQLSGNGEDIAQDAVNTHADLHLLLAGFHVDITRALVDRALDNRVDKPDGGSAVGGIVPDPVGGESTHCVLTGHTGMPDAKLLTDLNKVQVGDRFTVTTLNRELTYEVESVTVVVPDETEALRIRRGEDLCTLVTCTPYGLNTHRLLVTGHRVENAEPARSLLSDSYVDALMNNPIMIALAALLIMLMITYAVTKLKRD